MCLPAYLNGNPLSGLPFSWCIHETSARESIHHRDTACGREASTFGCPCTTIQRIKAMEGESKLGFPQATCLPPQRAIIMVIGKCDYPPAGPSLKQTQIGKPRNRFTLKHFNVDVADWIYMQWDKCWSDGSEILGPRVSVTRQCFIILGSTKKVASMNQCCR